MRRVGGQCGIGSALSPNQIGGESFIRHIGNDKLIYDFKSGSGTVVHDKSHCGNNGTFGAGAAALTWRRNSLYFDGGDYVTLTGINHGISTGGLTFCCSLSNFSDSNYLFDQQTVRFIVNSSDDKIRSYQDSLGYLLTDSGISSITPISSQVTRDNSGNLECYVNGKSSAKGLSASTDVTYNGTSEIRLGSSYTGSNRFTGTMYSFRILNKGLSGIEAQQIYLSNKFRGNN